MSVPTKFERIYHNYVVDPIIRGSTGIELPGGPIQVALGGQYRQQAEDTLLDDISDRNINPCATLGVTNCAPAAQLGPLLYNRPGNVHGAAASNYREERRKYPVAAGFFETRLPILSNLDVNLAGRYEKFYSDVTDKDNSVFVPAASLKWQIIDQVGFRTSWGETFSQVNPPRENPPITGTSATSAKYTGLGGTGQQYSTFNFPNLDVEPQKGTYFDVGFLFDVGNFRANVDYYAINVDDYTRTMAVNNVLDALAVPIGNTSIVSTAVDINCSSGALTQPIAALGGRPLVELVGPCVQGVTKMSDLTGGRVNFFGGNRQTNSGELKTSGVDLSMSYTFENFLGGEFVPSIDFSRVLKWELGDFVIGGVKVADGYDGLGFVNGSTGRIGQPVAKYRASLGLLFRRGPHLLNIISQYVPEIINDDQTQFVANVTRNANTGDANGVNVCSQTPGTTFTSDIGSVPAGAGTGEFGNGTSAAARGPCTAQNTAPLAGQTVEEWLNFDIVYRLELPADTALSLTINNVLDEDPSFFRAIVPYNTGYGSPLGRNFKLGVTKRF